MQYLHRKLHLSVSEMPEMVKGLSGLRVWTGAKLAEGLEELRGLRGLRG